MPVFTGTPKDDIIDGSLDPDQIWGDAGDDHLYGHESSDEIYGDEGHDHLYGGQGEDALFGGEGNDTLYGGTETDKLSGGADDDIVYGGEGNDYLFGDEGHDVLYGDDGDDSIEGGKGSDALFGGKGNDVLLGGGDDDKLFGDEGDDDLFGDEGNDYLFGGEGQDDLFGGDGDDVLYGGDGNDDLIGGAGNDTLYGDAGNDKFDGEAGDDVIYGGDGDDYIYGGAGYDTIWGDAGDDSILAGDGADVIHGDGNDVIDGGAGGDDKDTLDLTGSVPAGGSLKVFITGTDSNGNGFDGYVEYYDALGNVVSVLKFSEIESVIPCFTAGTMIVSNRGTVPVEDLRLGDRVLTKDNGFQELVWTGTKTLQQTVLAANPALQPIRITKGALGNGLPLKTMHVSPQHRMLISGPKVDLWFGTDEVLVPAKYLTVLEGVDIAPTQEVTYIHIMCKAHELVQADGAWTESFQPADHSRFGNDSDARSELAAIFPELDTSLIRQNYTSARLNLKKHEAMVLLS